MAYSVNGKIYTDHPLMDEIVDCCKTIFKSIVVKNDALALSYETDESLEESRQFMRIVENVENFATFPFTHDMLASFTKDGVTVFTESQINDILYDRNLIPEELRDELMVYCRKYYIENYQDRNNYYRSLAGLPPYPGTAYNIKRERSDSQFNIYIYESDFPSDYDTSHIDFTKPIHLQSADDISILQQTGKLDDIIDEYRGFNYSYLRYLGYKSIDVYKARKAIKWEILYMPKIEQLVEQRFEELYNINRSIYLKRTYQDAMALGSNHYDESIILLLLCQTFNDLVVDVPEWYIRRDIFDIRSVQYFLESFGVQFFDVIPLKYQIAIVKNLNKLIKYKSSAKNNNDIIDLFNLTGTYIYKYFLYKKKDKETTSEATDNYELEFIKVKQGDAFDKYIDNNIYRYKYDDLTLDDKFWDGVYKEWNNSSDKSFKERLHEEIRQEHIEDADYTVEGTKYMSIDYEVDMSKYKYQVEYFFNYILDSKIDTEDLKIIVPTISTSTEVGISNLFIMLYLFSFAYDNIPDKVIRPEDRNSHKHHYLGYRAEYYEPVYRDDGDFDDFIKWNEVFGTYVPPAHYVSSQFNFGSVYSTTTIDDDGQFEFGDIVYNLDYLQGDYDFDEMLDPPDNDYLYDFDNIYMKDDEEESPDIGLYDFGIVVKITPIDDDGEFDFYDLLDPDPESGDYDFDEMLIPEEPDEGWDFMHPIYPVPEEAGDSEWDFNSLIDLDPDEYWKQFFVPKHWEVKEYIENYDPIATIEGYNSYEVWAENYRDWAKRRIPEALEVSYDKVNGFNNALTPADLDKFLEFITRRLKVYNYYKGYTGYSYAPVYNMDGELKYYEIKYEYDEMVYSYDEYLQYVAYPAEPKYDPSKETWEQYEERHQKWEETTTEEGYNEWLEEEKEDFMFKNPRGPLGIGGFRIVKMMDTIDDVMENFDVNTACYNDLVSRIYNSNNRDESIVLNYVFTTFCNRQFDYDFYSVDGEPVEYMKAILKDRSYILYNFYNQVVSENNPDTRKNNIRAIMNDIITTLEYYLSGDNIEFIYSTFSITSFSNLVYYLYLMINFFKSWKVYFLNPVVTINTDDRLENGNNYGQGMDSISEIKLNYWHEDKEFKRDTLGTEVNSVWKDKFSEQVKEVLDVYGHFDPDPEDDYDYDGYTVEEVPLVEYKDANGGVADGKQNIPYKMINGGKAYGKLLDIWDLDGAGPLEMQNYLRVDGGGVYQPEDWKKDGYGDKFNYIINAGNPGTNQFWTKTAHTRVIDRKIEQKVLVSDKEANLIVEDENGLYLQQAWASWKDFDEVKVIGDTAFEYIDYVMEVLYEDLIIITDDELLTQRINELVADQISDMRKVANYVENIDYYRTNYHREIDAYIDDLENIGNTFSPYDWVDF